MALGLAAYSATTYTSNVAASATVVSPSFSPAAGDVIYCVGFCDNNLAQLTENAPTNSGTALTWNFLVRENTFTVSQLEGSLFVWWAYNANAQTGITVTVNSPVSTAQLKGVAVIGFTGASSTQAGAVKVATPLNPESGTTPTSSNLTTSAAGSWIWMAGWDWTNFRSTIAPASGQSAQIAVMDASSNGDSEWLQKENPQPGPTRAAGTVVTMSDTGSTSGDYIHLIAWEVVPAAGAASGPPFYPKNWALHAKALPSRPRGVYMGVAPKDTSSGTGQVQWNIGAPARNPQPGPVFRQATAPARARIPQNAPRGRGSGNPGAPVQNPVTGVGPVFYPAVQAIRARLPQPPAGMGAPRGRVASSPGAPVRNPVRGPVFVLKPSPVRYVLPPWQPRAGRIGSSFGAVVQNPSHGPPVYAPLGPARARLPQLTPRAGRVTSNAGGPVSNPVQGPRFAQRTSPVRASLPLPRRGRTYATPPATAVVPPVFAGPPFYPARQPVRARLPLRPAGTVEGHAGPPAQNPVSGPVFVQATQPARARIPQVSPRGRTAGSQGTFAKTVTPAPVYPLTGPVRTRTAAPFSKGRAASSPGAPVRNPSHGPVFRQAAQPARIRPSLPPRGRIASNPGGPVANPAPGTTGPVFYPRNHARARQPLPRRGVARAIRFYPAPANPQAGAAFPAWHAPVQARRLPLRGGRVSFTPVTPPAIPVPNVVAVTGAIPAAVRAALPVHLRGQIRSAAGSPAQNPPPVTGPVFYPRRDPARSRIVPPPRGRVASSPGGPVQNPPPVLGPVFRQATQPARIRPSLPPRGRVASNPGVFSPAATPGVSSGQPAGIRVIYLYAGRTRSTASYPAPRNPTPGPVFRQAVRPAQARFPLPPRGRTASNPGGPVQNPPPVTTGPVFRQATAPARIRPSLPPRGRIASSPGAPVRNPSAGPVFRQATAPARAHVPQVFSKGRTYGNPGTPPVIPAPVYPWHGPARTRPVLPPRGRTSGNPGIPVPPPVTPAPVYPAHGPVRIRPSLPPRGRVASNPGIPVAPPPVPAPVYPLHGPVAARRPLPPHGRCITGNPGAPVRNPHQGAVFHSLPWPARTRIPQNAPRGRTASNPGGPVENIPFATLRFRTGTPFFQWPSGVPGYQWAAGTPGFQQATGVPQAG